MKSLSKLCDASELHRLFRFVSTSSGVFIWSKFTPTIGAFGSIGAFVTIGAFALLLSRANSSTYRSLLAWKTENLLKETPFYNDQPWESEEILERREPLSPFREE